jgi:hypothetical protein
VHVRLEETAAESWRRDKDFGRRRSGKGARNREGCYLRGRSGERGREDTRCGGGREAAEGAERGGHCVADWGFRSRRCCAKSPTEQRVERPKEEQRVAEEGRRKRKWVVLG